MSSESEDHITYDNIILIGPYVNVFLCAIAASTSIAFKKQRVCPTNLIICVSVLGFLNNLLSIIRNTKGSSLYNYLHRPGLVYCRSSLTIDMFFALGTVAVNTFLAFSLWNMIYRKRKMSYESNPRYQQWFFALFWLYTLAVTFGFCWGVELVESGDQCFPSVSEETIALWVPWSLCVWAQMYFVGSTLYEIKKVSKNISANLSSSQVVTRKKDKALYIRFVSIVFLQIMMWIALFVYYFRAVDFSSFPLLLAHSFLNQIGYFIESFVIMASNKALRAWINVHFFNQSAKEGGSSSVDTKDTSGTSGKRKSKSVTIDVGGDVGGGV